MTNKKSNKTKQNAVTMQIYLASEKRKKTWQEYADKHFQAESSGRGKVSTMVQKFTDFCIQNQVVDPSKFIIGANATLEYQKLQIENNRLILENNVIRAQRDDAENSLKIAQLNLNYERKSDKKSTDFLQLEDRVLTLLKDIGKPMTLSEIIKALDIKDSDKWDIIEEVKVIEDGQEVIKHHVVESLQDVIYNILILSLQRNEIQMQGHNRYKWAV